MIAIKVKAEDSGEWEAFEVQDSLEFDSLINRYFMKTAGIVASKNRQTISESDFPRRSWRGVVNGRTYTVTEAL